MQEQSHHHIIETGRAALTTRPVFARKRRPDFEATRPYFAEATFPSAPFTLIFWVVPSAMATFTV